MCIKNSQLFGFIPFKVNMKSKIIQCYFYSSIKHFHDPFSVEMSCLHQITEVKWVLNIFNVDFKRNRENNLHFDQGKYGLTLVLLNETPLIPPKSELTLYNSI